MRFETLVRLAALGTSGVCVLIVFWCGHTIKNLPPDTARPKYRLISWYLLLCLFIAVISALTGVALAAYLDEERQSSRHTLEQSKQALAEMRQEVDRLKDVIVKLPIAEAPAHADAVRAAETAANSANQATQSATRNIEREIAKTAPRSISKSIKRTFGL